MVDHGLSHNQLAIIKQVLLEYESKIEEVRLFGSRAKGTYKPYSDIDLVLYGTSLKQADMNRIWGLFEDSSLPVQVDVVAYSLLKNMELKAIIDQESKCLYLPGELK